jgi:hypothetical protein
MKLSTTFAGVALALSFASPALAADSIEHRTGRHCTDDVCVKWERWTTADRQRDVTRDERTGRLVTETVTADGRIFAFYAPSNTLTIGPLGAPAADPAPVGERTVVVPDGRRFFDAVLSIRELPATKANLKRLKLTPRPDAKIRYIGRDSD